MNKTVKTIGWICLVLGIMGTALSATAYITARNALTERQARFEEFHEQVESGEAPFFKNRQDGEAPGIGERDRDRDGSGEFGPRPGGWNTRGSAVGGQLGAMRPGRQDFNRGAFGFPLLALASGPVLLVIGLVTLIVNREPAIELVKAEKKPAKKDTKSK